jgi:hypothetical protein
MKNRVKSYCLDLDPTIDLYIDICGFIQTKLSQTDFFNRNELGYSYLALEMLPLFQPPGTQIEFDILHYHLLREYLYAVDKKRSE